MKSVIQVWKKQSLLVKLLVGMITGAILGIIFGPSIVVIKPLGTIFLNLLRVCEQKSVNMDLL